MNIYLDDERSTPEGYVRTYTVEETIRLIQANDGAIEVLSLDNDLGSGLQEGYKVLDWLEEEVFHGRIKPIMEIIPHTANLSARDRMGAVSKRIYKLWESQGYTNIPELFGW